VARLASDRCRGAAAARGQTGAGALNVSPYQRKAA
jgi:hypothetical protein